jgi:hypothetical protein
MTASTPVNRGFILAINSLWEIAPLSPTNPHTANASSPPALTSGHRLAARTPWERRCDASCEQLTKLCLAPVPTGLGARFLSCAQRLHAGLERFCTPAATKWYTSAITGKHPQAPGD